MTTNDRIWAGATALLLAGAVWRATGAGESPRVIWPELPRASAATPRPPARDPEAVVRGALDRNVFSASRTAPQSRYRVGMQLTPAVSPTTLTMPAPAPTPPPPPPPPTRYRIAGTMVSATGGMALIDADPSSPGPEVYRVGDAVGGYRLERVAYDHVVMVGAMGELRMDVARPGEGRRAAAAAASLPSGTPLPNAAPTPEVPMSQRAKSAANTPPGAIPPGW
jgi:hypothetical protein